MSSNRQSPHQPPSKQQIKQEDQASSLGRTYPYVRRVPGRCISCNKLNLFLSRNFAPEDYDVDVGDLVKCGCFYS
jgi:hypothetical protein